MLKLLIYRAILMTETSETLIMFSTTYQAGKLRFLLSHCSADRRRTRRSREQFQYFNMLASGTSAPVGREGGIINQIPIACNEVGPLKSVDGLGISLASDIL